MAKPSHLAAHGQPGTTGEPASALLPDAEALSAKILAMVGECGPDKTLCPSEVARAFGGAHPDGWGPLMQPIRRVAVALALAGRITILRKGKIVDPADFRGIYRLALPRHD